MGKATQDLQKEHEAILYVLQILNKMMNDQEQNLLFEQFEQHEEDVIGHGVHKKLHTMIDAWAEIFGVE